MAETKASIDSLRISREHPKAGAPSRRLGLLVAVVAGFAAALAGGGWYIYSGDPLIEVRTISVASPNAPGGKMGLDATGYVVARHMATLSAKISGKLIELNVEEGQHIRQGMVIARLDSSNAESLLRHAQAQFARAKSAVEDARPIYERYQRLNAQGAISTDLLERQRAAYNDMSLELKVSEAAVNVAKVNLDDTVVRAPFAGVVTNKAAQVGEIVAPSSAGGGFTRTGIATIVDMASLEVEVEVSENYIDRVKPEAPATVILDAYQNWRIPASVIAVIPTANRSKGTVKVRVAMHARDERILPEMGARVSFATSDRSVGAAPANVTLPREVVVDNGRVGYAFAVRQDSTLRRLDLTFVSKGERTVEILSGVTPGEVLVSGNLNSLSEGQRVSVAK